MQQKFENIRDTIRKNVYLSIGGWLYKNNTSITVDLVGGIAFLIFCLACLSFAMSRPTIGTLNIEYERQVINLKFEANLDFENIQINVNNKNVDAIDGSKARYFTSVYADNVKSTDDTQDLGTDISTEIKGSYFYYANQIDIEDYVVDGFNEVAIVLDIDNRTYEIYNPLFVKNSSYTYQKPFYEATIDIRK